MKSSSCRSRRRFPRAIANSTAAHFPLQLFSGSSPHFNHGLLRINLNGSEYCNLTIPAGQIITPVPVIGFNLPPLEAMDKLSIDIVSVGQTNTTTPGRDLTVTIRL